MCWLVIMCALALSRIGTEGAVISGDNTAAVQSVDKMSPGNECFSKCVPRCQQLLLKTRDIRCCSCISVCGKLCDRSFKASTNRVSDYGDSASLPRTPCVNGICDLPEVAWLRLLVPRSTKRRSSRSPMMREAAIIARSVGMDLGPVDTGSEPDESNSAADFQVVARLESLVQEQDAISALVSWDSLVTSGLPSGTPWYLVTWDPEGGGVRGNLLTNSTSVSLALWPNTVYHIQVSSTIHGSVSNCLEVDTHLTTTPPQFARGTTLFTLSRVEELGGVAAALLLFLVVLVVCATRWPNRLEHSSKHSDDGHKDCDRFKLYPPPVTLQHLAERSRTTQQLPV